MQRIVGNVDLCTLLDGEGSPDQLRRIEAELAGSPQGAARLAAWRRNDAALRFALVGTHSEPVAQAPAEIPAPPARRRTDEAPIQAPSPARARRASRALTAAAIAAFAGGSGAAVAAFALLILGAR